MRSSPLSSWSRPNGGAAHPTSTWPDITCVKVEDGLPVATGLGVEHVEIETVLLEDPAALAELRDRGIPVAALAHRDLQGLLRRRRVDGRQCDRCAPEHAKNRA